MRRQRHFHRPQIRAFLLKAEIATLIRCCRPDNSDIRLQRWEIQPVFTSKFLMADNRLVSGCLIHGTAFMNRVNKSIQPHLSQHTGAPGSPLTQHIKNNTRGKIIGRNLICTDHLPDFRWLSLRWSGDIRAADNLFQQTRFCNMISPCRSKHITSCNRMDCRDLLWMTLCIEPCADSSQNSIRAAQTTR